MRMTIFIEGAASGPDSKYLQVRCREAFHRLFAKCGLLQQPSLRACGGRGNTFKLFTVAHANAATDDFVALLIDSEEPVLEIERTWAHLKGRDNWDKPKGASDDQVMMMTTCMESWIASDRKALCEHYGANLHENSLPNLFEMETRDRHVVQNALEHATRDCKNRYEKGKRSFDVLGTLNPNELKKHLPSFERCERLLQAHL